MSSPAVCRDCQSAPITYVGCGQCGECYAAMLATMNANHDRSGCPYCPNVCTCPVPMCPDCRSELAGAAWGPDSVCLSCHTARMVPRDLARLI